VQIFRRPGRILRGCLSQSTQGGSRVVIRENATIRVSSSKGLPSQSSVAFKLTHKTPSIARRLDPISTVGFAHRGDAARQETRLAAGKDFERPDSIEQATRISEI